MIAEVPARIYYCVVDLPLTAFAEMNTVVAFNVLLVIGHTGLEGLLPLLKGINIFCLIKLNDFCECNTFSVHRK